MQEQLHRKPVILSEGRSPKSKDLRTRKHLCRWQVRRSFDSLCSLRMTNRVLHTNATVGPVGPPLPGWPGRTANRRARFNFPCHCEERSDAPQGGFSCPTGNSPSGNPHPLRCIAPPIPTGDGRSTDCHGPMGLAMTCLFWLIPLNRHGGHRRRTPILSNWPGDS